jgi:hypothetical protein
MSAAGFISILAALWLLTFFVLLVPAGWLGVWIARKSPNSFLGVVFCFALAELFVVCAAVVLVFARLPFLPHVNENTGGFGITIVTVFFFVPAFAALIVGFRRAVARYGYAVSQQTAPPRLRQPASLRLAFAALLVLLAIMKFVGALKS